LKNLYAILLFAFAAVADAQTNFCPELAKHFRPPAEFANTGKYSSLLKFKNGDAVKSSEDWQRRRAEIKSTWEKHIGEWPPLLTDNRVRILETTNRENFIQHKIEITVASNLTNRGYLLVPKTAAPHPAVVVPFYEPETSIGLNKPLRAFALDLTRRGFVTLSIGSPGGDARAPELAGAKCQPLHFLGYIAANCRIALANQPGVDPKRIGIVGHSYGGKWAMFASAFDENFAAAVYSDPGIVFDEARPNVNYWEPWYLGKDPNQTRKPGVPTEQNPRTGPYRELFTAGHDLHEVMALMTPRPFLVSGGSEDQPERWQPLNRVREVYDLLRAPNRVGMTNRPMHDPTEESNEQIYQFFECALKK
jgi:hypothetical protein